MINYWELNKEKMFELTFQHLSMVIQTIAISIVVASLILFLSSGYPKLIGSVITIFSLTYSIPSLAIFALLIPFSGLGKTTAMIGLVIYCQYILLRNFWTAIQEVDDIITESAFALGMTKLQVLFKIQIPQAMGGLLAGIRIASTATIGIATISAAINAGGLGILLFDGLRTMNVIKILWGVILVGILCLFIDLTIRSFELYFSKKWG